MSLIFRFKEWFHSKVIFLIALFLLFSNYNAAINFDRSFFLDLLFISIYLLSAAALGYYINDLFDQKKDEVAGKSNFAQQHNAVIVFTILTSLKLILFLNWFFFSSKALTGLLIGFQIILFYLYSNPITRLKEVYFFNIITDAVYAFVIPGFIIFFTVYGAYESAPFLVFILFLIWTFLMGIRGILYHYIKDYFNDLTSNTKTLATKIGVKQTSIINKLIITPIELITFVLFIAVLDFKLVIAYFIYLNYIFLKEKLFIKINNHQFIKGKLSITSFFLDEFYTKWLPLFILINLVIKNYYFFILLVLFLVIMIDQFKSDYKVIYNVFKKLYYKIFIPIYYFLKGIISFIVNHSLYYFFLLFSVDLKKRATLNNKKVQESFVKEKSIEKEFDRSIKENVTSFITNEISSKNVHSLWIGSNLTNMELLTINSFMQNGYTFHLWVYNEISTQLPSDLKLMNANHIIPEEQIFRYKNTSQFNNGKGSVAGFSDVFRYKLLYEKGGWWTDMDITCLRPFDVETPYFFRAHHELKLVGNLMKAPAKSALMLACYNEAILNVNENNTDWHKPIEILIRNVEKFKLEDNIYYNLTNSDEFEKLEQYYFSNNEISENWIAIHWCNEVLRSFNLNKNLYLSSSSYSNLLLKFGVIKPLSEVRINDSKFKKELLICNLIQIL